MSWSPWMSFFVGLAIGGFVGIIMGRRNYETCREQLNHLTAEMQARQAELGAMEAEITGLQHTLSTATPQAPLPSKETVPLLASATPEASVAPETATTTQLESEKAAEGESTVSHCPQKLARIHGIGRVYEGKLYRAGIGTFWQVATAPNEKLAAILEITDFQAVDLDAIKADARRLAESSNTVGMVWSGQEPDDFEALPGIGKTYEARLYEAGVCTFAKLAAMSEEEIAAIVKAPKWNQPDYAAWIAYAQAQTQRNA